jgi:hypothetical protein
MKNAVLFLVAVGCLIGFPLAAQKRVPYAFAHRGIPPKESQLTVLTEVTQPGSSFLRLYFKGTQLGESSYLLLKGADGAQQVLRRPDLENWRFSSAYFNGTTVKVSLFAAAGEKNLVNLSEVMITDPDAERNRKARKAAEPTETSSQQVLSTTADITETHPHAKAVGRFTNGVETGGTGWIAPNGAIVTLAGGGGGYDVIEFNVPTSVGTTIQHPAPEDQYPVNFGNTAEGTHKFVFKGEGMVSKVSWGVVEALPNGTGLRPGERQQEYFRIAKNPSNYILENLEDAGVDLFHYGTYNGPVLEGTPGYKSLRLTQTSLQQQNSALKYDLPYASDDRDLFVVYSTNFLAAGAPVVYEGSNVAIGLHHRSNEDNHPAVGVGFKSDNFRNGVARFFTEKSAYLDWNGVSNQPNGQIDKPYLTVQQAAQHAPNDYTVYIAKGTYPGAVTFDRPLTLRAPVGTVKIGANQVAARTAAGPTIPPHWLEGAPSFDRASAEDRRAVASPNPFREQVTVKYPFSGKGPVSVTVYNTSGAEVTRLVPGEAEADSHTVQWNGTDQHGTPVPAGLYFMKTTNGNQTVTTKVMKQ